jgi:hypothetical protein
VTYSVSMDWKATLLEPQLIQITPNLGASDTNNQVSYNLRCGEPIVDFNVTDVGRPTINVNLPYPGEYTVTRQIRHMETGFTQTSATVANKNEVPDIEIPDPDPEDVDETPVKAKSSRKSKKTGGSK